jgi:hypothetical protein
MSRWCYHLREIRSLKCFRFQALASGEAAAASLSPTSPVLTTSRYRRRAAGSLASCLRPLRRSNGLARQAWSGPTGLEGAAWRSQFHIVQRGRLEFTYVAWILSVLEEAQVRYGIGEFARNVVEAWPPSKLPGQPFSAQWSEDPRHSRGRRFQEGPVYE